MLWRYHKVVYGSFDYYSALLSNERDKSGELAIWQMSFSAYLEFVRECEILT